MPSLGSGGTLLTDFNHTEELVSRRVNDCECVTSSSRHQISRERSSRTPAAVVAPLLFTVPLPHFYRRQSALPNRTVGGALLTLIKQLIVLKY